MNKKITHFGSLDSLIIKPYVEYLYGHFNIKEHIFFLINPRNENMLMDGKNVNLCQVSFYSKLIYYIKSIISLQKSHKIILHGLFDPKLLLILFFMPWVLRKCHWVIFGADLYIFKERKRNLRWRIIEFFRKSVIKNIGYCVTYIEGDYQLVKKWYGTKAKYLECVMYPSNLFKDFKTIESKDSDINLLVGNSADPSNNHLEVFDVIQEIKESNFKIYSPLAYGSDEKYRDKVIAEGNDRFGLQFHSLTELISLNDYLSLLSKIDIAIFNHNRQQAMGNIITLLGLGKKVYLRSNVTHWDFFKSHGIHVYNKQLKKMFEN